MIPRGLFLSASPIVPAGGGITIGLVVGIQLAIAAVALGAFAWYVRERRPGWATGARIGAVLTGLAGGVLLLAVVLDPGGTTGGPLANPVPDTVSSVDAGAVLYQANCARCHGVDGLGGGVDAGTTEVAPPNLRSGHLNQHSDADIYIWISSGLPGGMPAWSGTLSETDRWNLVNYLRAIDGRGPSPAPSAASTNGRAPELAGLAVSGTVGSMLLGLLGLSVCRSRWRGPSRRNHESGCERGEE